MSHTVYVDRFVLVKESADLTRRLARIGINCVRRRRHGQHDILTFAVPKTIGFGASNPGEKQDVPARFTEGQV